MHLHYCIAKCLEIQVLKFATSFCFLLQWHIGIPFPNTTLTIFFYYGKTLYSEMAIFHVVMTAWEKVPVKWQKCSF